MTIRMDMSVSERIESKFRGTARLQQPWWVSQIPLELESSGQKKNWKEISSEKWERFASYRASEVIKNTFWLVLSIIWNIRIF